MHVLKQNNQACDLDDDLNISQYTEAGRENPAVSCCHNSLHYDLVAVMNRNAMPRQYPMQTARPGGTCRYLFLLYGYYLHPPPPLEPCLATIDERPAGGTLSSFVTCRYDDGSRSIKPKKPPPAAILPHYFYRANQNTKKQKAMKEPMMMPSLRFRAEILPMRELSPGTWLAARVMRRLMLAKVSRCRWKLSWVA